MIEIDTKIAVAIKNPFYNFFKPIFTLIYIELNNVKTNEICNIIFVFLFLNLIFEFNSVVSPASKSHN